MTAAEATDDVTDAIAYIEMQRQEKAPAGVPVGDPVAAANVVAIQSAIQRVQRIAGNKQKGAGGRQPRPGHQHRAADRNAPRKPSRNKGHRPPGGRGQR